MIKIKSDKDNYEMQNEDQYDKCCEDPDIGISDDGLHVCRSCGMTFGRSFMFKERRAYTQEEVQQRKQTEPTWRSFGPRTVISNYRTDSTGKRLPSKKQILFNRLNKIQGSLINSVERNFWSAKPKMLALASRLKLPQYVIETAWKIYTEVVHQKLTMGRSIESFVCASLYAANRIHDLPRLLDEYIEVSNVTSRSVYKSLGLIVRHVLPELNYKYKTVGVKQLISKFGNELSLSINVQNRAQEIYSESRKRGLNRIGKDPKGLASAALYLAALSTNERKTQKEIADAARLTEVTLRTRSKQIQKILGL